MMNQYIPGFNDALEVLLGSPQDSFQYSVTLTLGISVFVLVFGRSLYVMGHQGVSAFGLIMGLSTGFLAMIAGAVLSIRVLEGAMEYTALAWLGVAIAILGVIGPILTMILKNGYFCVVSSWILATFSFVVLTLAIGGVFEAIESSGSITDGRERRNLELNGLIGKN